MPFVLTVIGLIYPVTIFLWEGFSGCIASGWDSMCGLGTVFLTMPLSLFANLIVEKIMPPTPANFVSESAIAVILICILWGITGYVIGLLINKFPRKQ